MVTGPVGQFQPRPGAGTCVQCPVGQYSASGASLCTRCGPGRYLSSQSGQCVDCPVGQYSGGSTAGCTPCSPGQYTGVTASSVCSACPAGLYSPYDPSIGGVSACVACAAGTVPEVPPTSYGCTQCAPGLFAQSGDVTCSQCAAGTYSSQYWGSTTCLPCQGTESVWHLEGSWFVAACDGPAIRAWSRWFDQSRRPVLLQRYVLAWPVFWNWRQRVPFMPSGHVHGLVGTVGMLAVSGYVTCSR